ncbi:MAG: hypothetical protein LRY67_07200 [Gammaproteobacteria bacterium]|nr:hypothetical protein [Gammaproteobacteria bacterium]MCD8543244.1 hypothetical protein [Gammaproteobacteria bacterium]
MVIFHIKHYLTIAGVRYFEEWFIKLSTILNDFDGFISAKYSLDEDCYGTVNLFLEFENMALLESWRSSLAHKEIKSLLTNYLEKSHSSYVYKTNNYINQFKSTAR